MSKGIVRLLKRKYNQKSFQRFYSILHDYYSFGAVCKFSTYCTVKVQMTRWWLLHGFLPVILEACLMVSKRQSAFRRAHLVVMYHSSRRTLISMTAHTFLAMSNTESCLVWLRCIAHLFRSISYFNEGPLQKWGRFQMHCTRPDIASCGYYYTL